MSVRRFIGYFIALCACSTVAFGSFWIEPAVTPDPLADTAFPLPPRLPKPLPQRKVIPKIIQVALAQ